MIGFLHITGCEHPVEVLGETPSGRWYRIRAVERTRLPPPKVRCRPAHRFIEKGQTARVPKWAVRLARSAA